MTCKDCRFHQPDTKTPVDLGECHRHAPVLTGTSEHARTAWPIVAETDWCGEFEAKRRPRVTPDDLPF